MTYRLPHERAPDGDPDVCVHCREEWVDLLTLYETDECSVRLRAALDAERAAVVAWLHRMERNARHWGGKDDERADTYARLADVFECGEHRSEEKE